MEKRESAAYNIYDKFKDINFQKHIMEACRIKFYKPNLLELFDTNTKLIGFENCVFDMENNILRYGQADDYITMTTKLFLPIKQSELPMSIDELWTHIQTRSDPINKSEAIKKSASTNKDWRELIELEWDKHKSTRFFNAVFKDINRFFEQIMPDIEIRKYCMEFIANRLCGYVFKQRFSIWTGSGGNGKSMMIDLIESVFGDSIKVSSSYTFHAPFKKYFPPLVSKGSWELRNEILSEIKGDYYTYTGDKAEGLMLKLYRLKPKIGQRKELSATSVKMRCMKQH